MFIGKPPPSLIIPTGSEMGANYGGSPHHGGSFSPSSTASSSPCPSTPSSSTHSFNIHHNHFQQHHRIQDGIPQSGMGHNGERYQSNQSRIMQRRGRMNNGFHPHNNTMHHPFPPPNHHNNHHHHNPNNRPPPPPFMMGPPPPFPPPPPGMMFPPPSRFMNGPPPPFFPPPYTPNGVHIDTSVPPPPYTAFRMGPPPPFMHHGPPPPHPSMFNRSAPTSPNGGSANQFNHRGQYHQQEERSDSRPSSREGSGSLASTEIDCGETSQDGSYESSTQSSEEEIHVGRAPEIHQGKRSFLVGLRPESKRDEPSCTPLPIGEKEFETFSSILTRGNKHVNETEIMDRFIVEYMKLKM